MKLIPSFIYLLFFLFFTISSGQIQETILPTYYIDNNSVAEDVKEKIEIFLKENNYGIKSKIKSESDFSIYLKDDFYYIKDLKVGKDIFKISTEQTNVVPSLITNQIIELFDGFVFKKTNLKNKNFALKFQFLPIEYDPYTETFSKETAQSLHYEGDTLIVREQMDYVYLEVENLGSEPLYFSMIELSSNYEFYQMIPNSNCQLMGPERRLEPGEKMSFEDCVFSFGPPYGNYLIKAFSSPIPINFQDFVEKSSNNENVDELIKEFEDQIFTSELNYKIIPADVENKEVANEGWAKLITPKKDLNYSNFDDSEDFRIKKLQKKVDSLTKIVNQYNEELVLEMNMRGSRASRSQKNDTLLFNYSALLIAMEEYEDENINDLIFPIDDATTLRDVLVKNYSFDENNVTLLSNPTRNEIFKAFDAILDNTKRNHNLLIFYAGHGVFDETLNRGYWLPSDARIENKGTWVSNNDIKDYISAFNTSHTLLISDACFSGSIFEYNRNVEIVDADKNLSKLLGKKTRVAITSGLDAPVPDESVFIKYLIKELLNNNAPYLTASDLFSGIREAVLSNTDNIPQFGVIRNAQHEGGEFVLFKK